jgi:hypothetical protein
MCFYIPDLHFDEKNNKSYVLNINIKKQQDGFYQKIKQTDSTNINIQT